MMMPMIEDIWMQRTILFFVVVDLVIDWVAL